MCSDEQRAWDRVGFTPRGVLFIVCRRFDTRKRLVRTGFCSVSARGRAAANFNKTQEGVRRRRTKEKRFNCSPVNCFQLQATCCQPEPDQSVCVCVWLCLCLTSEDRSSSKHEAGVAWTRKVFAVDQILVKIASGFNRRRVVSPAQRIGNSQPCV